MLQDQPYDLPETAFPVRQIMLNRKGCAVGGAQPRGGGSKETYLVFLDVDCIPHPDLLHDYAAACAAATAC